MEHQIVTRLFDLFQNNKQLSIESISSHFSRPESEIRQWLNTLSELDKDLFRVESQSVTLCKKNHLLNESLIRQHLIPNFTHEISLLEIFTSIPSTNDYLKNSAINAENTSVCLAEHQSGGRGRRGKQWVSPFAQNIYLSVLRCCHLPAEKLGLVSLVVGIAVADSLAAMGIGTVKVKWPNDIYVNNKKLAGILIDARKVQATQAELVIGLGLNVCMDEALTDQIDQPWISLQQIMSAIPERNQIVANLMNQILTNLQQLESDGFDDFQEKWDFYDFLLGHEIVVSGAETTSGYAQGITETGELKVLNSNGVQLVRSGEVSVRVNQQADMR